jgi:hypothetical protein
LYPKYAVRVGKDTRVGAGYGMIAAMNERDVLELLSTEKIKGGCRFQATGEFDKQLCCFLILDG